MVVRFKQRKGTLRHEEILDRENTKRVFVGPIAARLMIWLDAEEAADVRGVCGTRLLLGRPGDVSQVAGNIGLNEVFDDVAVRSIGRKARCLTRWRLPRRQRRFTCRSGRNS